MYRKLAGLDAVGGCRAKVSRVSNAVERELRRHAQITEKLKRQVYVYARWSVCM
jgi:hypothetical protein